MDWDAIGAIGEAIAAAGVIATLVYLAFQIRQNTNIVRAATFQQVTAASTTLSEQLYRDPELTRIFWSGVNELGSLSEEDRARFQFIAISYFRTLENLHHQSRKRLIDDEDWEGHRESFLSAVSGTGLETWWQENSFRFNRHFRSFIEEELRRRAA